MQQREDTNDDSTNTTCSPPPFHNKKGFRVGRSAMVDLIKSGDVRVNWREASKPSVELKEGDVVSVSGKGRLEVRSVTKTKKDKFAVAMTRFL